MAENYEVYDWDSEIQEDGSDFKLLEPGVYPFEVVKLEKEYYQGGKSAPACPKASVSLKVKCPDGTSTTVKDGFLLYSGMEWKISSFFRAIGYKQHGQRVAMKWDADWLRGKGGMCKISNREFTFTRGERAGETGHSNEVESYLDPEPTRAESDGEGW